MSVELNRLCQMVKQLISPRTKRTDCSHTRCFVFAMLCRWAIVLDCFLLLCSGCVLESKPTCLCFLLHLIHREISKSFFLVQPSNNTEQKIRNTSSLFWSYLVLLNHALRLLELAHKSSGIIRHLLSTIQKVCLLFMWTTKMVRKTDNNVKLALSLSFCPFAPCLWVCGCLR